MHDPDPQAEFLLINENNRYVRAWFGSRHEVGHMITFCAASKKDAGPGKDNVHR